MGSKKINWNKILSGIIAGISIAIACLFIGICFFVPVKSSVNALTKQDIEDAGIKFVSAKTKIRVADNYQRESLTDANGNSFNKFSYHYTNDWNSTQSLYYTSSTNILKNYSSGLGNVYLSAGDNIYSIFEDYQTVGNFKHDDFIPTYVTSYKNAVTGSIEDIFYDEADENDFVMLNNYTNFDSNNNFNVENFYLSFGTPYIDELEDSHTTPINTLSVSGVLYSTSGEKYNLVLNDPKSTNFSDGYLSWYWCQYFDLSSLNAYKDQQTIYPIENQQGKYEITFRFIKYAKDNDDKWTIQDNTELEFTYTFYLLDSNNYSAIPTLENAELGAIALNETSEYFYNFTTDYPTITYDPQKFNLSYIRENKEINETINSSFSLKSYTMGGVYYPMGIINFTDSYGNNKKQVVILTYYNSDKNLVEYLYLSNNSKTAISIPANYTSFTSLIDNESLDFEYKIIYKLDKSESGNTTTYTLNKYCTYNYDYHEFGVDEKFYNDNSPIKTEYIKVTTDETNTTEEKDANDKVITSTTTTKYTYNYSPDGKTENTIATGTKIEIDNKQTNTVTKTETVTPSQAGDLTEVESYNTEILNKLNSIDKINADLNNVDFEYKLTLDDLGIYTFDYNYNCIVYNEGTHLKDTITNTDSTSTNILKITDFAHNHTKETTANGGITQQAPTDLKLNVWGYLSAENKVTLNGIEYTYNPQTKTLLFNDGSEREINLTSNTNNTLDNAHLGEVEIIATYTLHTNSNGQYLQISYSIAELEEKKDTTTYIHKVEGQNNKSLYNEDKVSSTITLNNPEGNTDDKISSTLIKGSGNETFVAKWQNILDIVDYLSESEHNNFSTIKYSNQSTNLSQDQLHIFGSMSYFNKDNPEATITSSNNGKEKFRQKDSRLKTNYASDITKFVKSANGYYNNTEFNASSFKGMTNTAISNGLNVNDIIITDITPVFWKNLSSLAYNNKVSQSYIYRYPNYSIKADGTIDYGDTATHKQDLYTKDTYCSQDGLYEIVIIYKYDNYKNLNTTFNYNNTYFYQLFTFIIDNKSPKMEIKIQDTKDVDKDGDTDEFITNLTSTYTNQNVEISWNIPTFFQNDVYIDIERTSFGTSEQVYKATYKQAEIENISGNSSYVSATTEYITPILTDKKYKVIIKSTDSYNANGNYKVTLHYSSKGDSTDSEEFIIDKERINGMEVLPVLQNANGTYSVNRDGQIDDKQIINYDFTFRYNEKNSKAKIYTYWYKIDLVPTTGDKQIKVNNNETAITTTFKVDGTNTSSYNEASSGNQYTYNYDKSNTVYSANYFTSSTSCIYLFKMTDEAGNECRYVVFYDTTSPRFILDPKPKSNNIINDTTTLSWGDYKAIKIDTPTDFKFEESKAINNYGDDSNISNKLEEVLSYINSANTYSSSSLFNDTKIQKIDNELYMLLPISEVKVEDISTSTLQVAGSTKSVTFTNDNIPDNFYFFPADPISENNGTKQINIGLYNSTSPDDFKNVDNVTYQTAINSDSKAFNRFITASNTTTSYNGTIGKGEFNFQIYDGQRNKIEGYVWLTLDKTQTYAYGIFDNKTADHPKNATAITGDEGTYSLSKLYISSLQANITEQIPDYTLTYTFYQLNDDMYENLYENYEISAVQILNKNSQDIPSKITITGSQTYLQLTYRNKSNINDLLTYYVELTNEDGSSSAKHTYPYDLEGIAGEPDSNGKSQHIYDVNKSDYEKKEGENSEYTRLFSNTINPVPDPTGNTTSNVTQEGLYVFKRMYTNASSEDLGLDTRIIYYLYYVDRTGIINVTTLNSISENLFSNKQDFGFVLGSDYDSDNESLKKYINSDNLSNLQTSSDVTSTASNIYNKISNLFTTNKILVQFNVTADKYNFTAFENKFADSVINKLKENLQTLDSEELEKIEEDTNNFLFNEAYFSNQLYKINLTLTKGALNIINESESDSTKVYNSSAINNYLKGTYNTSDYRDNSFNLYMQDSNSNPYNIYLKDNSGYRKFDSDGQTLLDRNANPNQLDISFYIKHNAPSGEIYGKYYGKHNYDEDKNSGHSLPFTDYVDANGQTQTTYALLEKYLQSGQLDNLTLPKEETMNGSNGKYVTLYSTNNRSLIFTFDITQDDTQAQIDPNNIKIYKHEISESNLIFNRQNGTYIASNLVSENRMSTAFFSNVINGVTKYAIIVFDDNLDEILNNDESAYSNFRLLDSKDNIDSETYYIQINYVGNSSNYKQEDNSGNKISYHSTTYKVTIDRNKPEYNLSKLMYLDKYVYNPSKTTKPTSSNYSDIFKSYKDYYNFEEDEDYNVERSDLENYFFALDYREDSSFVFESIDDLDSSGGILIRKVDPLNYKFSKTPDDYKSYYEATYLPGNPQFLTNKITTLSKLDNIKIDDSSTYYYIGYGTLSNNINDKTIKASDLMQFLEVGNYYEIIEQDEAENYRVYAVYLPDYTGTAIQYEYKMNNNSDIDGGSLNYGSYSTPVISGVDFRITSYSTSDYFTKAILSIDSTNLKETLNIYYKPSDLTIYITDSKNVIKNKYEDILMDTFKSDFIEIINSLISDYNDIISNKSSKYYTQFGYSLELTIIDRIGIKSSISNSMLDYEFIYNVAGSIIEPTFKDNTSHFNMTIPAMQGTTYIEEVHAYIFQNGWSPKDPDDIGNSFSKTASELKKGTTYTLGKGVYKFVITDNFKRTNTYFYEFGTSTQSAGGTLRFNDKTSSYTDNYTYTAKSATFVYDNSIYDIYIKFIGSIDDITFEDSDVNPQIIYNNNKSYTESDLRQYGISVATIDSITTITFYGTGDLTKYHIKTLPASVSSKYSYTWGAEKSSNDFLVYDNKLAIYTGIQSPIVRNANGNILDTSKHLNLSEDFTVTTAWTNYLNLDEQLSFNSKIVLTRTYVENNITRIETLSNADTYSITKQGDYTAYVINDLNNRSETITFSRGESEVGIYSVLNVSNKIATKLTPSSKVTSENYETEDENRTLIEFNYYTTINYFSFKDTYTNSIVEPSILVSKDEDDTFSSIENIEVNTNASNYLDIQVKSDLSIFAQLYELKKDGETPYAKFRIYSKTKDGKDYTYRFVKVYFLDNTDYTLANTLVSNTVSSIVDNNSKNNNIYDTSSTIKRPDQYLYVAFSFKDSTNSTKYVEGNTIFVDRYYNDKFVETISYTNITEQTEAKFTLTQVGLHKFVIRDLAGRIQTFGQDITSDTSLQIYLINQILFEVNGDTPIDNQIFNEDVTIKIKSVLSGVTLYNTNTLGVKVTRNGQDVSITNTGEFTFSESGSYSIKIDATTVLADQEISTTYKFVIIKTDIANKSFNVSKGTGFEIDKVFKTVNNERTEMTESFKNGNIGESINSGSLIWLTADVQGNSTFEITLKYFNQTLKEYQYFTFNVWLNNDKPVIVSSISNGTATKDTITLNFNPGIIYTQVGKCKILINDKEYLAINGDSNSAVETITITQKGTYSVQIVSEDGTLISSYKYTKNDPVSKVTIIVLVSVAIGIVVLVVLFLLIRRKGKYR